MDQQRILQVQVSKLENELINAYSERASHQAKVADAATPTGNASADKSLQEQAIIAANTLAMIARMISTREAALAALTEQMAALNIPAPPAGPGSPPVQ